MRRIKPPDMSWLADARKGDREALGAAIEACRDALNARMRDRASADARGTADHEHHVSEGCHKALERFAQFRGSTWGEWYNWLRTICENGYSDELRRHGNGPRFHHFADLLTDLDRSSPLIRDLRPGVSTEAYQRELIERIKHEIPNLPKAERLAFSLYFLDNLDLEEIALLVGKAYDAVRIARDRGVTRLRERLGVAHVDS